MTASLTCDDILELLDDYVDGDLSADLCEAIEEHLASCHHCYVLVDSTRKSLMLYHLLTPPEMPEDVEIRLFKVLHLEDFVEE